MVRRLSAIVALAATTGLIAACGSASHSTVASSVRTTPLTDTSPGTTPLTRARAIAFARAVNLTPADVPGFKAKPKDQHEPKTPAEKRIERELARCTAGTFSSSGGLAEEGSKEFKLEHGILHFSVNSEVSVAQTPAIAAKQLAEIRGSRVRGCLSHYLELLFKTQILKEQSSRAIIGPNSISLSVSHGTPPAPGATGGYWWRITATIALHGVKLHYYIDILGFVYGPAEVSLSSSGALRPFPASIQEHLYLLLLKRAERRGL
jgi:hypothetical protein